MRDLLKHDALLRLVVFSTALIGAFRSLLFHLVICSLGGPLSHGSPVVVFFDRGPPRFWNFSSVIPVDFLQFDETPVIIANTSLFLAQRLIIECI